MPIVAPQHANETWRPALDWPDDCFVQWGKRGVVFSKDGNYQTAFFEVFPKDGSGGFIRGEGESIESAETASFEKWSRQFDCHSTGGHRWSRACRLKNGKFNTYTNGGCFCLKCNAFETVMKPIVKLGSWKAPLTPSELSMIGMGCFRPSGDIQKRYARKLELRAKAAGVNVPDWRAVSDDENIDTFEDACYQATVLHYVRCYNRVIMNKDVSTIEGIMDVLAISSLKRRSIELGLIDDDFALEQPTQCTS